MKLNLEKPPKPKSLEAAHHLIEEQWRHIEALQAQVEALEASVEALQSRSGCSSRNSTQPPSMDSPAQRHQRRRKPASGRKRGAQPGHKKHERARVPEERVDRFHRYYPDGQCACGGPVVPESAPYARHQLFDLPVVRHTVTEYQSYAGTCGACGKQHKARLPHGVPTGQMGPGLISQILLLSGQFHLSIRQIQQFLKTHWQLDFSIGAISQAQGKANPWLGPVYRQIGEQVRKAPLAHADETRHIRGTNQRWLWALVTETLCYFMVHYARGKAAASALLGDFHGYLVTDHYAAYNDVPRDKRQLCWAHLIRHFLRISERKGQAGQTGKRLLLIAHSVFRTHHRHADQPDAHARYQRRMQRLRKSFQATLQAGSELKGAKRTANQCRHLLKDEPLCWTFLQHPAIPLTNNLAERAIRPYVIWRKLSYAVQSHHGDQFRPMIASIIETCLRLGINTSAVLREICAEGLLRGEITLQLPLDNRLSAPTP